jgi:hypothetical protein
MQFLQLFPVAVAVQSGSDHGIQRLRKVAAVKRDAYLDRCRRRRVVEDAMLMVHGHILAQPRIGAANGAEPPRPIGGK